MDQSVYDHSMQERSILEVSIVTDEHSLDLGQSSHTVASSILSKSVYSQHIFCNVAARSGCLNEKNNQRAQC